METATTDAIDLPLAGGGRRHDGVLGEPANDQLHAARPAFMYEIHTCVSLWKVRLITRINPHARTRADSLITRNDVVYSV